ncbi:hypothetical protein VPH35_054402 [Triticum aestivum]
MNPALMCCAARRAREATDRVVVGVPLTEPLRMRAEGEAWVAIGVPLIEPRPRRKPSPCETPLIWRFAVITGIIFAGIVFTVTLAMTDTPLGAKIVTLCIMWALFMTTTLFIAFEVHDGPEDISES